MNALTPAKQNLLVVLMMICVALVVSSMDVFLPALPLMRDYFGATESALQLTMMASPFMCALVGLLFGRLSDLYGRRVILLTSLGFFLIGGFGCCIAADLESFALSRVIQSIGSGGLSIVAVVVVADMFHGIQYARYMAIYGSLFPITFAVSPIIGAQLTEHFGWRSCFILNFGAMLVVAVILQILLPETLKKGEQAPQGGFRELLAKGKRLLTDREFLLMALGHALPISLSGLFFASGAFVFIDGFAFTPSLYAFSQAIPIVFNFIGVLIYRRFIGILGIKGALKIGMAGFSGFVAAALGLVTHQLPNTPLAILAIFSISNFAAPFIVASCATRAFEIFPQDRGLSVSVVATLRNIFLAGIVSLAGLFFNGSIFPVYIAMILVCMSVLAVLVAALQRPLAFAKG